MTRVERLEKEIAELSGSELDEFRAWFAAFDAERWENEILHDMESGTLDALIDQAAADHRAGRTKPL
jgi:hypothetical protein